jgi:hypothetical protein
MPVSPAVVRAFVDRVRACPVGLDAVAVLCLTTCADRFAGSRACR